MGWLQDSGSGLRGAAAREARKERLKERQDKADVQVEKIDGAAAREARKRKLQEKEAEEGLTGAALRQKRKERQAAKEQEQKRLKEEAEKKRSLRLARVKDKVPTEDDEERQKRLAEKIAARRAAMQQNEAMVEKDGESGDEDEEEEEEEAEVANESSDEEQASNAKKNSSLSASSEDKKIKKKEKKEKKKKKKKKKKKSSSSSTSSGPSEEAKELAKTMAMQTAGCFAWERKAEDAPTITDFNVLVSAATPDEVENFLKSSTSMIDPAVVQRFRNLPPPIQKLVIDRGPINNSLTPSNVLGARCRDAEMGKFGLPGQAAPPENPKIEALIKKYDLDINCAHRMRHEGLRIQKAILALHKDIEACSNPSGLIMAKLNELNPPTTTAKNHTGLQIVYR